MELLTDTKYERKFITISIAYLGSKFTHELGERLGGDVNVTQFDDLDRLAAYIKQQSVLSVPDILLLEIEDNITPLLSFILALRSDPITSGLGIVLLAFKNNKSTIIGAFSPFVDDIYFYPFNTGNIEERLKFIIKFKSLNKPAVIGDLKAQKGYRIPIAKRLFDIVVAGSLLLMSSPIMLLVAALIKIDSKGSVFYKSKRAGSGYKVFDFYKFRSMKADADQKLAELSTLNQYAVNGKSAAFVKIKNDPRITRLGAFLRNTSLDELPQLFNVLKGDMSLVGNRPLPLYEAQMLTSDEWSMRFLGPAGITGLWQVNKRGKSEMSDQERKMLDNYYTEHFSFWMDLKIIFKTFPALIQREKV